jgi:hypothetical protein
MNVVYGAGKWERLTVSDTGDLSGADQISGLFGFGVDQVGCKDGVDHGRFTETGAAYLKKNDV